MENDDRPKFSLEHFVHENAIAILALIALGSVAYIGAVAYQQFSP